MPYIFGLAAIVGVVLYFRWRADGSTAHEAEAIEQELLSLCLGNRQRADRLIALEKERAGEISRTEAARRAVRSFKRDLR